MTPKPGYGVSVLISLLIVLSTLSFGAVYPWGYLPLFAAGALVGLAGVIRSRGIPASTRAVSFGLLLAGLGIAAQLVPVPPGVLARLSPHAADLLSRQNLTFAANPGEHPFSIRPAATVVALAGLGGFGLCVIGLPALFSKRDLRLLPRNLMLFAVPLALFGMYTREHNNGLVYGLWRTELRDYSNGFGPFVNRNHFAGWMLMATSLAIGIFCGRMESAFERVGPGWRNRLVWMSTSAANRIMLVGLAVLTMAVSLVWTVSRSGIVSFACALCIFAWLAARRRHVGQARRAAVIISLGAVLLAGISWRGIDHLVRWFADTRDFSSRLEAWRDGWQVVRDFPITGTGINTYPDVMIFYQKHVLEVWMTHAHNDYLQLLAEGGLLIAVPTLIAAALLIAAAVRSLKAARHDSYEYWVRAGACVGLLAVAIQETVEFSLHIPANAFLFATLAAVALAPVHREPDGSRTR